MHHSELQPLTAPNMLAFISCSNSVRHCKASEPDTPGMSYVNQQLDAGEKHELRQHIKHWLLLSHEMY